MPNRSFSSGEYRYGFQGQEKENDVVGEGLAFKYRIHDARIGRFLSRDPLTPKYPWNSPYAFSENKVISLIELEGLETAPPHLDNSNIVEPVIKKRTIEDVWEQTKAVAIPDKAILLFWKAADWLMEQSGAPKDEILVNVEVNKSSITEAIGEIGFYATLYELGEGGLSTLGRMKAGSGVLKNPTLATIEAEASAAKKPYSSSRPTYGNTQVDDVWEAAKQKDGKVYDPNTGQEIIWDKSKPRNGQWDMGHKPGKEYRKSYQDYMNGKTSLEDFLKEYRNPENYQPEVPANNRSKKFEK